MRIKQGPMFILAAAVLWSLGGVGVKFVPWSPLSIACIRGGVAAIAIGCIRRQWRVKLNFPTVMAAACMTATTVLFMSANKMTTAANAIVLQNTAPIYVILLSIFLLKVRPRPVDVCTMVLSSAGIALFFLDHLGHGALWGDVIALVSGLTFAGVFFFNSLPGADPQASSFLGCGFSVVLLPFLFFDPALTSSGPLPWLVVIFLGVFQLGVPYFLFSKGIQETGAVTASILCMLEPILNPVWVFLAMGERPGPLSLVGAGVVILTICLYNAVTAWQQANALKAEESLSTPPL